MDLGGFPVRILIQFVLDKQQKSITKHFSGALGNKIAGHKKICCSYVKRYQKTEITLYNSNINSNGSSRFLEIG